MIDARLNRIGIVMMSAVGDVVHVMPILHAMARLSVISSAHSGRREQVGVFDEPIWNARF